MSGWWVNPFGISPNVKVGPNLALSISIIFTVRHYWDTEVNIHTSGWLRGY
jgi:hypothetical protein